MRVCDRIREADSQKNFRCRLLCQHFWWADAVYSKSRRFKNIETKGSLFLVVANTGIKHSTSDLVAGVKRFKDTNKILFESLAKQASDICLKSCTAIESGKYDKVGEPYE